MVKSTHIISAQINDPRRPGSVITLDIHEVPGGIIGIQPDYAEQVSNHVMNPYEDCQIVLLSDPEGGDDEPDPPMDEDELVGFLKIINAVDVNISRMEGSNRSVFLSGMAKLSGISVDRLEVLFGLADKAIKEIQQDAFERFKSVLSEEKSVGEG